MRTCRAFLAIPARFARPAPRCGGKNAAIAMMAMQMTQQLFRNESLVARRDSGMGGISLAQPVAQWVLATSALLVVLAIASYLYCASYTQRSTVTGRLVPALGLATVLAPASGVMAEMGTAEGAMVAAGQRLAVINVPRTTLASGAASPDLEAALRERGAGLRAVQQGQQRALAAQASGLGAQIDAASAELSQVQAQIDTRQQQTRINSTPWRACASCANSSTSASCNCGNRNPRCSTRSRPCRNCSGRPTH